MCTGQKGRPVVVVCNNTPTNDANASTSPTTVDTTHQQSPTATGNDQSQTAAPLNSNDSIVNNLKGSSSTNGSTNKRRRKADSTDAVATFLTRRFGYDKLLVSLQITLHLPVHCIACHHILLHLCHVVQVGRWSGVAGRVGYWQLGRAGQNQMGGEQ